jgi:ElaB/YqjD/DUF883 family membrane-anchored ribosome-binding protein
LARRFISNLAGIMFHHRSSTFRPSVNAIAHHLTAVEKELEKVGRIAGRRGSAAAAAAGEQLGEAISTVLSDMLERFRHGGQVAGDRATRLGSQALALGGRYGNDALERVAAEVEDRPLITVGVALGIGILIGAAVLGSVSSRR